MTSRTNAFIASFLLVGSTIGVQAADLPARVYTKAASVQVYDWSGIYIGANGGWGSSHSCWLQTSDVGTPLTTNVPDGCHNASGGTAGGQIGYRWQRSAWVFGLEAQGNWADFHGSNVSSNTVFINRSKLDGYGLFTGQVGYAWDSVLLYAKGGAAVVRNSYVGYEPVEGVDFDRSSETRWGGTVGIGAEYAISRNVSFGLEYDHLFMGNSDTNLIGTGLSIGAAGVNTRGERISQDVDTVTARLNFHFN